MMTAFTKKPVLYAPCRAMAVIYKSHAYPQERISEKVQQETLDMISEGSPINRTGEADRSTISSLCALEMNLHARELG
jgi:hypothetical protein